MAIHRLPAELLELISQQCDHASQKESRLVNQRFQSAATPSVFEHFYMGYFEHALDNFYALAKSPLAKYVKRFTIYSDLLPEWPRAEWESKIDLRPDFSLWQAARRAQQGQTCHTCKLSQHPCLDCACTYPDLDPEYRSLQRQFLTTAELDVAYGSFLRLVWKQQCLHSGDLRKFKEHFAMLPNVSEASVKGATPFSGRTNEWPVWKGLRKTILVGPDDWMYPKGHPMSNVSSDTAHQQRHGRGAGQAALYLLEGVGYRSQFFGTKHITKLSVQAKQPYRDLIGAAGSFGGIPADSQRYQTIVEAFRHVEDLSLNILYPFESNAHHGPGLTSETVELLRAAKQLRRLDFTFFEDEYEDEDGVAPLFATDENFRWPHLEHLALRTNIESTIFLDFLKQHAGSLRSLELRDMVVNDIEDVLECIPRIVKLQHVYAECLWGKWREPSIDSNVCLLARGTDFDDPYERSVKAYLLGERDDLVELKREDDA